jgi:hypothetical protein
MNTASNDHQQSAASSVASSTSQQNLSSSDLLKSQSGGGAPVNSTGTVNMNIEYLKNCIYKYMTTLNLSEKQRLYKVIATILNFTTKEVKFIEEVLQEEKQSDPTDQIQTAVTSISSSLGYWFGSSTSPPPTPTTNTMSTSSNGRKLPNMPSSVLEENL